MKENVFTILRITNTVECRLSRLMRTKSDLDGRQSKKKGSKQEKSILPQK